MSRKESLVRGAAALAVAGLLIKLSNLLVRVPLTRTMTAEGLGIYQMALPAFYALFHIAAGGVPVAVQNLVAEYMAKDRRAVAAQVLGLALSYSVLAGGAASVLMMVGAPTFARLLGEPKVRWALLAVGPAVVLFAVDSIYRNYLQGRKLMTPSATASVLEQGTKVGVTLAAAFLLVRATSGVEFGAAGAALGITAGAVVSVLYMLYVYRQIRVEDGPTTDRLEPRSALVRRMIKLAWPVTLGSVFMPVLQLMDVGIVQRGFQKAGYQAGQATAMYGYYSGIAVQVTWFPFVLTNALANAMIPVLAGASTADIKRAAIESGMNTLRMSGITKIAEGMTTVEEVLRITMPD
jgi:stage V sporulation protein B